MRLTILIFVIYIISNPSFSKDVIKDKVALSYENCDDQFCITLTYSNRFNKPICIRNSQYPYDGNLNDNVFQILDESGKLAEYKNIEPSLVTGEKFAALVRLVPAGGVVTSTVRMSEFYEFKKEKKYSVRYSARAYFCNNFDHDSKYIWLSGITEINE